jgi:ABC-2 type transport system permease protein
MAIAYALRLGRWGLAGFSIAALFSLFVQTAGFYRVAGDTPAERTAFGNSMLALANNFVAVLPPPVRPDTVGGYVQFRGFNALAILFAVWALASATGFARGDEERGLVESTLSAGISRARLIASRMSAFAISLAIASTCAAGGLLIGIIPAEDSVQGVGVIEACALLVALGLACYAIALVVAQVVPARAATAAAGAALLALFLLNSLSRVFTQLSFWRWLSPFRYYDLNQPLPSGGYFDGKSFVALLAIALVASIAAAVAFAARDLGSGLFVPGWRVRAIRRDATDDIFLRYPVVRGLYERRLGIAAWTAGLAILAIVFVSLTRTIVQVLLAVPSFLPYLSIFVRTQLYPGVLGFTWLNVAQLLFAGLAITYVARWAAEDSDGRLEATLSEPVSRVAVVLERMSVLAAAALVIAVVAGVALYVASHQQGIDLNGGRLAAASLMLVPFTLVFAGAGALLTAWNPRAAVGVLSAFAFLSYLDTELGAIFKLPGWVQSLSAFKLFGTPLLDGVDWSNVTLMLALAAAGLGGSILAMQRRDVGA